MEVETAVNTNIILKVPMILLERKIFNDVQRIEKEFRRVSAELEKLDTTTRIGTFIHSMLIKKLVEIADTLPPLNKQLRHLQFGNGIQEDKWQ